MRKVLLASATALMLFGCGTDYRSEAQALHGFLTGRDCEKGGEVFAKYFKDYTVKDSFDVFDSLADMRKTFDRMNIKADVKHLKDSCGVIKSFDRKVMYWWYTYRLKRSALVGKEEGKKEKKYTYVLSYYNDKLGSLVYIAMDVIFTKTPKGDSLRIEFRNPDKFEVETAKEVFKKAVKT